MTDAERVEILREALRSLLPGLVLDLRYADPDDDRDAMECRVDTVIDALKRTAPDERVTESLSARKGGGPKACTPAEESGIAGATGAGQLPDGNPESTGDSAERRSPAGHSATPDAGRESPALRAGHREGASRE